MSGVIIIRALLAANTALTSVVPASKIMAGVIPINTVLPAISISQISGVTRNTVSMNEAKVLATDRVQITVMAKDYASQKSILDLVRAACPNTRGTVNGVACDSIWSDTTGPDVFDDLAVIYFQSVDMMVRFIR